jgi:hypothetical protein
MRRLVTDLGIQDVNLFFEDDASNEQIRAWVERNLNLPDFELNEPHSCKVTEFVGDITISGDEDLVLLKIENIKPEKLTNDSQWSVWVGGGEVNDFYLTEQEAENLANQFINDGYNDVEYRKEI